MPQEQMGQMIGAGQQSGLNQYLQGLQQWPIAPRPAREMTISDLGLPGHDWATSEGRKAAIWERINVTTDPTARKLELMRCRLEQVLPVITSEEFAELWKCCESNPLDGTRLWDNS